MSALDALLGLLLNNGVPLELRGGLNFVGFDVIPAKGQYNIKAGSVSQATPMASILAVASPPGWCVIGAFTTTRVGRFQTHLVGSVSDPALTLTARIYCVTPGHVGPIVGSESVITSVTDVEALSSLYNLDGPFLYQIQAQAVGNAGEDYFATIRRASPEGT